MGKPAGTVAAAWLLVRISRGTIRPPVGWAAVTGAGAIAGIGFTVSLLIASLAFHGSLLAEAKVGVLSAALCASLLGWAVFRLTALLPEPLRARALLGTAEAIIDLAVPVDPERDHVRGADLSGVTGTPTFFVNGKRHRGAYDIDTLADAVRAAKAHALIGSDRQPQQTS